jgi:hypothetical protein
MPSNPFIGRRDQVGIGIEPTPGTGVASQIWVKQTKLDLDQSTTVAQDKSAIGRLEDISDSAVTEQWAEGSLAGRVYDLVMGYLLANIFGTPAPTLHSGETTVWDNLYTLLQTAPTPTLTLTRVNPEYDRKYALGVLSDLEIDVSAGGFVTYTATLMSMVGATSTDTPTYVTVNGFTSKHVTLKYASAVSGLAAATALQPKSFKIKLSRKADRFVPLGGLNPVAFDQESFGVTGEFVTRFTETTEEAIALANTRQAFSAAIVNTDVTIGTATNPALTFTMPQVEFKPIKLSDNLDQVLTQTISFTAELSTSIGYMVQALLTCAQNGFAHA